MGFRGRCAGCMASGAAACYCYEAGAMKMADDHAGHWQRTHCMLVTDRWSSTVRDAMADLVCVQRV